MQLIDIDILLDTDQWEVSQLMNPHELTVTNLETNKVIFRIRPNTGRWFWNLKADGQGITIGIE